MLKIINLIVMWIFGLLLVVSLISGYFAAAVLNTVVVAVCLLIHLALRRSARQRPTQRPQPMTPGQMNPARMDNQLRMHNQPNPYDPQGNR
jgi:hypothetical protein